MAAFPFLQPFYIVLSFFLKIGKLPFYSLFPFFLKKNKTFKHLKMNRLHHDSKDIQQFLI
jgi:hypothetical protein